MKYRYPLMTADYASKMKGCSRAAIHKAVERGDVDHLEVLPDRIIIIHNKKFDSYTPRDYPRKK